MSVDLYYTAPSHEMFEEIKRAAIKIWQTYDNEFGYVDEKVDRIKDLENVSDNYMFMVSMFDVTNQAKLFSKLRPTTVERIREALK